MLYITFQALKIHSEMVFDSTPGKKLYNELIVLSQRLFAVAGAVGAHQPKAKLKASFV